MSIKQNTVFPYEITVFSGGDEGIQNQRDSTVLSPHIKNKHSPRCRSGVLAFYGGDEGIRTLGAFYCSNDFESFSL